MVSIRGLVAFTIGVAAMLVGVAMAYQSLGNTMTSLGWGVLAFAGMFPFVYGTSKLLFEGASKASKRRGNAPGKT